MNWETNGEMAWAAYGPVELRVIVHNGAYTVIVYGYSGRNKREYDIEEFDQAQARAIAMAKEWFNEANL
jgi:hypothetical protein